jgi:uncharacterized Rossmann fold enzyme
MPQWKPIPLWAGKDAYIIGGGPSLKTFDWKLLHDKLTIGINAAYILGSKICSIVIFGDMEFYSNHKKGLQQYGGPVFTNVDELYNCPDPWLYTMRRQPDGLSNNGSLGWNWNTGASAINLALLLGAKRVILLGYDMAPNGKKFNWHEYSNPHNSDELYERFKEAFQDVVRDWKIKFADREIINVTDKSELQGFPKVGLREWFTREKAS